MSADWALIVLVQPLCDALLVEQMTTGKHGRLLLEVVAADGASGVLKGAILLVQLAELLSYLHLRQIVDRLLRGGGSSRAASVLHGGSEDLLKQVVTQVGAEVHLKGVHEAEEVSACKGTKAEVKERCGSLRWLWLPHWNILDLLNDDIAASEWILDDSPDNPPPHGDWGLLHYDDGNFPPGTLLRLLLRGLSIA